MKSISTMFRLTALSLLAFPFLSGSTMAQISINQTDMPVIGDTIRLSTTAGLNGIDHTLTGAAYTWDFSTLSPLTQSVDTFLSVSTTPFLYQLIFNNPLDANRATLALKVAGLAFIPGFEIGDVFEFYRNSATAYGFLGYAGEFTGLPLTIKYNNPDVWYRFPLDYGDVDSSQATFSLALPGLGYVYSDRKRKNTVDGWGSLSTPYGTFQVLRVRSVVDEYDSIFLDTLSGGFGIQRLFTEYKWMAKGYGLPILQVTEEGPLLTITYLDSAQSGVGITNLSNSKILNLSIVPNPVVGVLQVELYAQTSNQANWILHDIQGRPLMSGNRLSLAPGLNSIKLAETEHLPSGIYFIDISGENQHWRGRFIVN